MKLELNTNGAWRTVLSGLGEHDEDQLIDARTAAADRPRGRAVRRRRVEGVGSMKPVATTLVALLVGCKGGVYTARTRASTSRACATTPRCTSP